MFANVLCRENMICYAKQNRKCVLLVRDSSPLELICLHVFSQRGRDQTSRQKARPCRTLISDSALPWLLHSAEPYLMFSHNVSPIVPAASPPSSAVIASQSRRLTSPGNSIYCLSVEISDTSFDYVYPTVCTAMWVSTVFSRRQRWKQRDDVKWRRREGVEEGGMSQTICDLIRVFR